MKAPDPVLSARGKLGITTRLSREDPQEMTAAARQQANWQRYYDQTDPALPEAERQRRARELRHAHMARMQLASQLARRARKS
jgi:hypothetical protein